MGTVLRVGVSGWEDGEWVDKELEEADRWAVQVGERICVTSGSPLEKDQDMEAELKVTLRQRPKDLGSLGVGALVWEASLVLAQHLASLPRAKLAGARVVELGAGLGLVGLLAYQLGAKVTLTDLAALLPTLQRQLEGNLRHPGEGTLQVCALEWGAKDAQQVVERLKIGEINQDEEDEEEAPIVKPKERKGKKRKRGQVVDYVIAADFMYPETPGLHGEVSLEAGHPAANAFFEVAAGLCTEKHTKCLLAFEVRGEWMLPKFLECARARFKKVRSIGREGLPEMYRREHIEMYELSM